MAGCLATYVHHIDPYAIKLVEGGPIRWYAVSYLVGFVLAYLLMRRVIRVGISTIDLARVADMVVYLALGVMIGGRLGYVLFYQPSLIIEFSGHVPFWGLLALNQGGMASHGGMIGVIIACFIYALRHRHRVTHVLDLAAFATPIGLFFGRIANFINAELYGRACSPNLPWAVKFPQEISAWSLAKMPSLGPAFEAMGEPADEWQALVERSGLDRTAAETVYAMLDRLVAVATGALDASESVRTALEPLLTPRHPSQIYQAMLEGLAVFAVLLVVWLRPRKPCVIGGMMLLSYGIMRVIGECFRQPDEHIADMEWELLHITRGQLLSIPVILAGLVLVWHFSRKPNPLMGGWWRRQEGDEGAVRSEQ